MTQHFVHQSWQLHSQNSSPDKWIGISQSSLSIINISTFLSHVSGSITIWLGPWARSTYQVSHANWSIPVNAANIGLQTIAASDKHWIMVTHRHHRDVAHIIKVKVLISSRGLRTNGRESRYVQTSSCSWAKNYGFTPHLDFNLLPTRFNLNFCQQACIQRVCSTIKGEENK